jgi:autophagy-related protein 13
MLHGFRGREDTRWTGDSVVDSQDKRDIERYVKFFTHKAVQVIVQSRKGEKRKAASKPNSSGEDWFNLVISDDTDLNLETKDLLAHSPMLADTEPVCVEISLQIEAGQSLALEIWKIVLRSR